MSEHEFEAYLNLLARTLKLSEAQRARIAGELRDHLEARMTELIEEEHLSKEDAVLAALDEFGDANVLAHDLTGPATQLKRKRLMQTGFSVIATAAVVAVAATWLTPSNFQGHPTQTVATAAGEHGDASGPVTRVPATAPVSVKPLDQKISLTFADAPLGDVFEYFRQTTQANILVDWAGLRDSGLGNDSPVTVNLKDASAGSALKLLLDAISQGRVTYQIVDEIVFVGNWDMRPAIVELTTQLYECNGLIEDATLLANPDDDLHQIGALNDLFRDILGDEAWETSGASIAYFGGVVVVRQTPARQELISDTIAKVKQQVAEQADARRAELAGPSQDDF